ncbi:flavodoxin domain-containing protein [Porticoccus sp. W117]|uniref:flavodoxin domain-containing protein n=1 Tax=Porticoccus sp. W117 TaxID=3054777 RepID=UPI002597AC3B|nr:flavodoxin domain-containing protein [Porticoccus sp. W117]MDM3872635.1 flavodoxin domain-containing protein [Porticoccus sp. W117]
MTKIRILVGSETGTALDVADALEETLTANNCSVAVAEDPSLDDLQHPDEVLLICTSSTGVGDFPSNINPFVIALNDTPPNIAGRRYGVISLGDSSFETYAAAATRLDGMFSDIGAVRIGEPLFLDALETFTPDKDAITWVKQWVTLL